MKDEDVTTPPQMSDDSGYIIMILQCTEVLTVITLDSLPSLPL